jgi:hypothetical protein
LRQEEVMWCNLTRDWETFFLHCSDNHDLNNKDIPRTSEHVHKPLCQHTIQVKTNLGLSSDVTNVNRSVTQFCHQQNGCSRLTFCMTTNW